MSRLTLLMLLFMSDSAIGDAVDDYFNRGVLGVAWGSKLEVVQSRYPNGSTWNTAAVDGSFFAYEVPVPAKLFGLDEANLVVHFSFNEFEQLCLVNLLYRYDQREAVMYHVAEALGHYYLTRNEKHQLITQWKSESKILVSLATGDGPPHTWVRLVIDANKLVTK